MQIDNNKKGFISIMAMIAMVAVVGGGIFMGTAVVDKVAKSGCGDSVERWRSGQSYADIADNKEGAIEDAQKCQKAVIQATEVAKANAALLGRASNISGSGIELISTEAVNMMMDYVEESSKENYKPLNKNNRLPNDILENIKEKERKENDKRKINDTTNDTIRDNQIKEVDEKDKGSKIEKELLSEKEDEFKKSDCELNVLSDGRPSVLASCEKGSVGFWYSDKDKDILKLRVRFRVSVPELGGYQELEWQETVYKPKDDICGFEPTVKAEQEDFSFGGYKSHLYVDIQLIDSKGNFSNVSNCQIK
jgi:hypothetical protein